MPKIAILHTSFVFVNVESVINDLIAEIIPEAEVIHFVDSDVLATVIREQVISKASEARMTHLAEGAEEAGADIIFSACSSLGPALDVAVRYVNVPIVKIDEAMAVEAVRKARRIGILATVPTTLAPTADLILEKARDVGRSVTVEQCLCDGAFDVLMSGNRTKHDAMVFAEAAQLATRVDLVVLAQASMNRLADPLSANLGLPVLTSPRSGVRYLAERLRQLSA